MFLVLLIACAVPSPARAQDASAPERAAAGVGTQDLEGRVVTDIEFIGAQRTRPEFLRSKMKTKVGRPLSHSELNDDLKTLAQDLRLFATATAQPIAVGDTGVKVLFYVTENPRAEVVILLGNEHFEREEILADIQTREGGLADDITLDLDVKTIREKYRKEGFHFVQVSASRPEEEYTTVIFTITEGPKVTVGEVTFLGAEHFEKSDLLDAMPLTDEGGFLFGHPYDELGVRGDLIPLQRYVRGHGFLDATVALEDRTFSADKEEVFLTFRIVEGEPYHVRSLRIEGAELFDAEQILADMKTRVGDRYEPDGKLGEDLRALNTRYWEESYINVRIRDETPIPLTGHEMDVLIRVVENDPVTVGNVVIEGNVETRDKVIRRLLEDLAPGRPLNLNTLDRARARVGNLGYFERTTLELTHIGITAKDFQDYREAFLTLEQTEQEDVRDVYVHVDELDTGSLKFAAGINSNAGVVGAVVYRKENFDPFDMPDGFGDLLDAFTGGGQTLELAFYPGVIETQFQATYIHPFIFDSEYEFNTVLFRTIRLREAWDQAHTGFTVGIGRRFGRNIAVDLRYRLENVDVDDIDDDAPQIVYDFEGQRLTSSIRLGASIAELDSFLSPAQGYRVTGSYEYAGLGGDLSFHKFRLDGSYYETLGENEDGAKHVLWFDGSLGYVVESGDTHDVPIYERFFAGGQNSVRGFAFRGLGPHENDHPTGGRVVMTGSLNYEFPLYQDLLRGVVFLDTGTVASDWDSDDVTNFRVSTGFGIRLKIPFLGDVPFAIDLGVPLVKDEEDETQLISFSLSRRF